MRRSRTKYLSATLHRIERNTVVAEARRAGFLMVGESAVLSNPADPLTVKVFDPSIRGHTSQFALKFQKPARPRDLFGQIAP